MTGHLSIESSHSKGQFPLNQQSHNGKSKKCKQIRQVRGTKTLKTFPPKGLEDPKGIMLYNLKIKLWKLKFLYV